MAGRSMIDADFEDEEDVGSQNFGDDKVLPEPKDIEEDVTGLEVEVEDDTPLADRGRKTADDLPDDDDNEDEAKKYSKDVQARINKATARTHAERRAKEERERQLSEAAEFTKRLIQENNHLKGLVENGEKVLVSEHQGRLDGQLAQAKVAYREAHEAGDVNGMLAAQENLARVAAQIDRLSIHRQAEMPRMDEARELTRFQPQQQAVEPDATALSWKEKNKWFGRDDVMTAFAMGMHTQMVNREGIDPNSKEYWSRLDGEVQKRFPERFQKESAAPRRTETLVAPAGRSGGAGGKMTRKVTLTESQVKLARRIGLTPEQYAEQLLAERGNKEFSHG